MLAALAATQESLQELDYLTPSTLLLKYYCLGSIAPVNSGTSVSVYAHITLRMVSQLLAISFRAIAGTCSYAHNTER